MVGMASRLSTKPPTGFRDFLGTEAVRRKQLEETIAKAYRSFGYLPLDTPALENLEVLFGSGGQDNEKLVFKTLKRGEKLEKAFELGKSTLGGSDTLGELSDLGLRFDLTVPLCRVVAQYQNEIKFPWKVFHIGPVWRAERPQKGRFREFMQCDVDIIGGSSRGVELDVIQAVGQVFKELKLNDFKLHINDRRLITAMAKRFGFGDKISAFAILLDKKDKLDPEKLKEEFSNLLGDKISKDLEKILEGQVSLDKFEAFDFETANELAELMAHLTSLETGFSEIVFDPSLARGMGYYTGTVFEVRHSSVGYSLGGGGRYDELIGRFLKNPMPACGFSIGFERLLLFLEEQDQALDTQKCIFMPVFDESLRLELCQIASNLRLAGLSVDLYPDSAKAKKQMQFANDRNFKWALIIARDEIQSGQYKLKNLETGDEKSYTPENLHKHLLSVF